MLSTEPDLPCCSSEIILKSSCNNNINTCDERLSDGNQVLDLFNSGLDDKNPIPKFSIRDYVFSRRGKDIETHWPFSPRNLQLCLKHGVKDVLPPFQTLDALRNPSTVKSDVGSINDSHVKLSRLSDDHNLPVKLSVSKEDKEYPTTTKNKSSCDLNIKSRYLEPEAENLSKKVENNPQNPVKKCNLIVKSNNICESKSKEEMSVNASETMASKVCPVCKTFSSSSNTTLNAHIDQCLSEESNVKCTKDSKVVKHRIKPRKTRLMVDIYETALHCTLEDLDRRNGTNWASNLSFPPRDLAEENDKTFSSEDKKEENAVYVDSNGTKLRILSKFNNPLSSAKDDNESRNLVEKDEGNKVISSKKKYRVQKHNLLNRPHGKRSCSTKSDHRSEVNNDEQRKIPPEKGYEKDLTPPVKDCDRMKIDDFGMIKSWVCSKRTGLKKKVNPELESQHIGKVKNSRLTIPVSSDANPLVSIESRERNENLSCNSHGNPRLRKRTGIFLSESQGFHGKKNHVVDEQYTHPPKGTENHASSHISKRKRISIGSNVNDDRPLISSRGKEFTPSKKTSLDRATLSQDEKLSSPRKNLLSESQKNLRKKHLYLKKRKLYYMSESEDEAAQTEKPSHKSLSNKYRVLKIQKKNGAFVKTAKEVDMALKGSEKSSKSINCGVGTNVDSFTGCNVPAGTSNVQDAVKDVEIHEKFVCEPNGEAFVAFSKSLDSQFAVLGGEQEMFCGDKVIGEDLVASNAHLVAEIDANEGNYFVDVDPIPIPGPPGSFLPSPRHMGSDELQGNSSLTTCVIHSSEDDHELNNDMDSSDCPISATSVVSNSIQTQNCVAENSTRFEGKREVDDGPRANSVFSETSSPRVDNSQPCCCSRKEGVLQSGFSNYQDSQLLKRRSTNALTPVTNTGDDRNNELYGVNLTLEKLSEKEQTPQPKKVVANSSTGYCGSPSPSTPNPILRLMGKDLMVVNKEENIPSPQTRQIESRTVNEYPNHYSFHNTLSRGPPVFDNMQTQNFGFNSIHDNNFRTAPSKMFGGNFGPSFEFLENGARSGLARGELEGQKSRTPPIKEIIVIDDSPENESMGAVGSQDGLSGSTVMGYDTRRVINPIYGYPSPYYPICNGSQMVMNTNIQMMSSSNVRTSTKWNCTGEGSRTPASLPPTGHSRSSLYFSHGFP